MCIWTIDATKSWSAYDCLYQDGRLSRWSCPWSVFQITASPSARSRQLWRRTGNFLEDFLQFYVYDLRFKAEGLTTFLTEFWTLPWSAVVCGWSVWNEMRHFWAFWCQVWLDRAGNTLSGRQGINGWNMLQMQVLRLDVVGRLTNGNTLQLG